VKIRSVDANNRRKAFLVQAGRKSLAFPYAKCVPSPTAEDPVARAFVDPEIGNEGFTYVLASGGEGTVHIDHVLEYNQDPRFVEKRALYELTLAAQSRVAESALSQREIIRRLGTSASQYYRLLDQTNSRKSIGQLLALLEILDCDVDFVVRDRR
jgi:predicted XRE-type DNA-binding protein